MVKKKRNYNRRPVTRSEKVLPTIWMVTREYEGLAGVGGVKDVCRQLAESLVATAEGQVRVILPCYGFMMPETLGFTPLMIGPEGGRHYAVDMCYTDQMRRESVEILTATINGVQIFLVMAERFQEKQGIYTYTATEEAEDRRCRQGMGHYDYFAMNILLQKTALDLMILLHERPAVIHCHDGHAATLPAMMRENSGYRHYFRDTGALVTVHNAGLGYHQEVEDLEFAATVTGLPRQVVDAACLSEAFDPFLAAAPYAVLNTVSENYARELRESDEDDERTGGLGHALMAHGVELAGVTNGINPADYDPRFPKPLGLAAAFHPGRSELAGKVACKQALLKQLSGAAPLADSIQQYGYLRQDPTLPLLTFIGRLTAQKGVDVMIEAVTRLLHQDDQVNLLVLGSGEATFRDALEGLASEAAIAGRICFLEGYGPRLAQQIYAAGDFFLIPSLYEPCGLTDYLAQLAGNLPIVHQVGGLVKVLDGKTGFSYEAHHHSELLQTIWRALHLYRHERAVLEGMQRRAIRRIQKHHTWEVVKNQYLNLYRQTGGLPA